LKRALFLGGVLAVVLASSTSAAAQTQWPAPHQEDHHALGGGVPIVLFADLGFWTGGTDFGIGSLDGFVMPLTFGAYFTIEDVVELGAVWGFAGGYLDTEVLGVSDDTGAFVLFNPFINAAYRYDHDLFVLRVGGGVALPVANADSDVGIEQTARQTTLALSAAMRGLWNFWLYDEERISIVVPNLRIDSDPREVYVWALETALGFLLETGDRDRDTEAVWQVGVELGARIDRVFVLGARLGVWLLLTPADMEDAAQASLEPFIRWHLEPIYLQAAFLMNLDTTLGFDRPGGTIWGLRFGMGAHF